MLGLTLGSEIHESKVCSYLLNLSDPWLSHL